MTDKKRFLVGLPARRELLRATLRAFDNALIRSPDNALLKSRRARLAEDQHVLAPLGETARLLKRLAEIEDDMAQKIIDPLRMQDLLREREELLTDLIELGDEIR